ncbi:hypothetical protein MRB53_037996 [Persea americana]|nr:hypothetical protein MRB53_037996 [Persea americana]
MKPSAALRNGRRGDVMLKRLWRRKLFPPVEEDGQQARVSMKTSQLRVRLSHLRRAEAEEHRRSTQASPSAAMPSTLPKQYSLCGIAIAMPFVE